MTIFQNLLNKLNSLKVHSTAICLLICLMVNICLSLIIGTPSFANEAPPREYALKAGFIYKFTKFVHWPSSIHQEIKQKGLVICVAGENPFGEILREIAKKVKKKRMNLFVRSSISKKEMSGCHILFISKSENSSLQEILGEVQNQPILLIGDTPNYAERGVGINFFIRKNKIRFKINQEAVKRAGLQISSELLNLATLVEEERLK